MRILVAGDGGYIGGVLVPFLRAARHQVDGYDLRAVTWARRLRTAGCGRRGTSGTPRQTNPQVMTR